MSARLDRCACTCGKAACASRRRDRTHGNQATYRAGCRCPKCVDAESARVRARDAERADATRPRATHAGQQWTGAEMEQVMRDDLTVPQLAALLGRSYKAVVARRSVCRSDPKWQVIP